MMNSHMLESFAEQLQKKPVNSKPETLIRVLHVDDDAEFLKSSKRILEMHYSFQIETALSVKEALQKLRHKSYDVIASDYLMPERNGLDLLKELRDRGNDVPFILFTGKGREEVAIKALNLGADQYVNKIGKPEVVYHELMHAIREVMKIKEAEKALQKSEEKYRSIVELSPDGIATMNMKGVVTSVNKAFLDLTGFSKDEIIGKHFTKLGTIRARDLPKYMKLIGSIVRGKKLENFEFAYLRKDGTQRLGEARISLLKEKGKTVGLQAILRDITDRKKVEEALRRSEEKYRKQFEEAMDAIFLADAETGVIVDCNRAATKLIGRKKSELVGQHQRILHPPEEINGEFSRTFKQHLKEMEGQVLEAQVITKSGEIRDVAIKANVFELGDKRIIQGTFRDITEQKKAEDALRESEEKYRELLNGMNDTAWVIDFEGNIVDVNDAAVKVLGYSRKEFRSIGLTGIDSNLDPEEIKGLVEGMPADEVQVFETVHTTKDGKKIPVEISSSLVTYQGKQAILSIARDITERKKTEEELVRLSSAVKTSIDGIIISDLNGKIVEANEATLKMYGTNDKNDLIGKNSFDLLVPEDQKKALVAMKETLENGYSKSLDYNVITKNCSKIPVEMSIAIMKAQDGKPIGFVGVARDIADRKRMEKALQESEERFRQVAENSWEWIWEVDANGLYTYASPVVEGILGYKAEELVGKKHFYDLFHPEDREELKKAAFQGFAEKSPFHEFFNRNVHKNGNTVWLSTSGVPIVDDKGNLLGYRGSDTNITERKLAEKALQESEEKWRYLTEYSPDQIMLLDKDANILYVNRPPPDLTSKEMIGESVYKYIPSEFHEVAAITIKNVFETGKLNSYYTEYHTKKGEVRHFEVRIGPIFYLGEVVALISSSSDITERKKAEEKLDEIMNELMAINEKLGVVGKLTRHDARNKLSVIANNVYLAKQKLAADHSALEFLGDVESTVDQIEEIFDFARNYEMLGVEELSSMDVGKSVEEAAMLFSGMKGVKLVNECQGLVVMADSLLRQLFYNLIDDTVKHGEKVSQIRVYYEEGDDQLKLVYEDDGVGIPENEKELIFKEGYGKGTGYGLYLIKKICEAYGWTIRETGKQGKGAQFTMIIPKTNKNGKASYCFDN